MRLTWILGIRISKAPDHNTKRDSTTWVALKSSSIQLFSVDASRVLLSSSPNLQCGPLLWAGHSGCRSLPPSRTSWCSKGPHGARRHAIGSPLALELHATARTQTRSRLLSATHKSNSLAMHQYTLHDAKLTCERDLAHPHER